jgi:TatD DNase family protein
MQIIDTHTHIYLPDFKDDIEDVLQRAATLGVTQLLLPAIDSQTHEAMLALQAKYPQCISMMGLHPCSVASTVNEELAIVEGYLKSQKFVAVGEIGLDFYWDKTFATQQYLAFETQMQWGLQYGLPIAIHTRNAMQETINTVKPFALKGLKGVFHCFSGSYESAKQIIDLGFLLGIGGVVTYKNAGVKEVLQKIPLEHIVLETDAPYLTPVPHRGKRNEPSYLEYVINTLCAIYSKTSEEIAESSYYQANKLFSLGSL